MSSVRSAVASALAAPLLLLVASAAPAAAQGGAAENGTYYVKDAATGHCLAGTRIATCGSSGTEWTLRNHGDGTVQFQEAGAARRCLSLPEAPTYPAAVHLNTCDATLATDPPVDINAGAGLTDRWRIEGFVDGPFTIAHAYPPAGRLAVQDSAVRVSNNSSAMWVLVAVGK